MTNKVGSTSSFIRQGPILSEVHHRVLLAPYTRKDMKKFIFKTDSNKSPGLNVYSVRFFKVAWARVGDNVTAVIL